MVRAPNRDQRKARRKGESYVDWLRRVLAFAKYWGRYSHGLWICGYCALERHGDCIIDCGCPNPQCQPHSSGTTGAGIRFSD